jgi:CRISPR-associated protein Csx10
METYKLKVTLLSDTTFGRGDGVAGLVDTEVEHDQYGLPFLRGRSLKGLLAEEGANILFALEQSGKALKDWKTAAHHLWGYPGSRREDAASIHIGAARLPADLRDTVRADIADKKYTATDVLEALTTTRQQTAMDSTGKPEKGALRTTRVILHETTFEAPLWFTKHVDDAEKTLVVALLAASAQAVRRVGTTRNRGRGQVRVRLYDPDGDEVTLQMFEDAVSKTPPASQEQDPPDVEPEQDPGGSEPSQDQPGDDNSPEKQMPCAVTFTLHLKEPVLATALDGDPNSAVSLPYIPGSMVRGALVAHYLAQNPTADLAADPKGRKLFLNEQTRYLNAYPVIGQARRRALPTPLSWKVQKGTAQLKTFTVYDLSQDPEGPEPEDDDWQARPVDAPFCDWRNNALTLYSPKKQVQIHTQRDRKMGRATESQGAVFRYEALALGQDFGGVILCADEAVADELKSLLETASLLLGGSQSAGYGRADIVRLSTGPVQPEVPGTVSAIAAGDQFTITLLSDALLRDAQGQYTGTLTSDILGAYLGTLAQPVSVQAVPELTHTKAGIVGGFNCKWGLPLPQTPVACMGSVFTFEAIEAIAADKLKALVANGIGERRAEGFGRLALNWHTEQDELQAQIYEPAPLPESPDLSDDSSELAQVMAVRMQRRVLDAKVRLWVNTHQIQGDIRNTQLSGIRTLIRTALSKGDLTPITGRLNEMKDAGRDQFEKARLDGQSLDMWLKALLTGKRDTVWETLHHTPFKAESLCTVGEIPATWDDDLAREYALRLIDGVLSRKLATRRGESKEAR